jgi:hypothetical protein
MANMTRRALTVACLGLAAITVGTVPARAWIVGKWQCGEVEVTLRKYATKTPMDLTFNGYPYEIDRLNFRFVGTEGAKLNGKACRPLPWDSSWGEELRNPAPADDR